MDLDFDSLLQDMPVDGTLHSQPGNVLDPQITQPPFLSNYYNQLYLDDPSLRQLSQGLSYNYGNEFTNGYYNNNASQPQPMGQSRIYQFSLYTAQPTRQPSPDHLQRRTKERKRRCQYDKDYTDAMNNYLIQLGGRFDPTIKEGHNFLQKGKKKKDIFMLAINGFDKLKAIIEELRAKLKLKDKEHRATIQQYQKALQEKEKMIQELQNTIKVFKEKEASDVQKLFKGPISKRKAEFNNGNEELCNENEEIQRQIEKYLAQVEFLSHRRRIKP